MENRRSKRTTIAGIAASCVVAINLYDGMKLLLIMRQATFFYIGIVLLCAAALAAVIGLLGRAPWSYRLLLALCWLSLGKSLLLLLFGLAFLTTQTKPGWQLFGREMQYLVYSAAPIIFFNRHDVKSEFSLGGFSQEAAQQVSVGNKAKPIGAFQALLAVAVMIIGLLAVVFMAASFISR